MKKNIEKDQISSLAIMIIYALGLIPIIIMSIHTAGLSPDHPLVVRQGNILIIWSVICFVAGIVAYAITSLIDF